MTNSSDRPTSGYYSGGWVLVSTLSFLLSVGLWCNALLARATAQRDEFFDAADEFDDWATGADRPPYTLAGRVVDAVNCGGPKHTDIYGITYRADTLSVGISSDHGRRYIIQRVPKNDQILYQTERYNHDNFGYDFQLPGDGDYVLVMKFSEVYFQEPNQKIFSVLVNDAPVVSDMDIFSTVGHGVAHDVLVPFKLAKGTVSLLAPAVQAKADGNRLSVTFAKGPADNPKVNALYVLRGGLDEFVPRLPPLEDYRRRLEQHRQQQQQQQHDTIEDVDPTDSEQRPDEGERRAKLASGPPIDDPYAQDVSQMFLPILVALAAFFPALFCLCRYM